MNLYREVVFRLLTVSFVIVVLALPGLCQNGSWTGQVQCQLSVQANGYTHQETQTWTISGTPTASGAIEVYPASWSSNGKGAVQQPTRTAQWTVNVQPTNAALAIFIRNSDNRLVIKSYHSQLYSPAGVTGTQILPSPGTLQYSTNEWILPVIEDSPTSTNVSGSAAVAIAPSLLPFQTNSSPSSTASCSWQFSKGTGGLPQPTTTTSGTSLAVATPQIAGTSAINPTILGAAQTQKVTSSVPVGHSSNGAACWQPNPMPDINSGLSHAFESDCMIQFSGSGWNDVASWNLPPHIYALFVTVHPLEFSDSSNKATPDYSCNLNVGLATISGVGNQADTTIGVPSWASVVQLQCGTWSTATYKAWVRLVAIQVGALN